MEGLTSHQCEQKTQTELKENIGHTATTVLVLSDDEGMIDDVSKVSIKRKNPENKSNHKQARKVSKINLMCSSSQSEDSSMLESESDLSGNTQVDVGSVCSTTTNWPFSQHTKGMRLIKVDDFFPDLKLFLFQIGLLYRFLFFI